MEQLPKEVLSLISAESGVDLISIADRDDSAAVADATGAALLIVGSSANFDASSGISPLV